MKPKIYKYWVTLTKIAIAILPLLLGLLIYIQYRGDNLFLFAWAREWGWIKLLVKIKQIHILPSDAPFWVKHNLPDGLWMFSFTYCYAWLMSIFHVHTKLWLLSLPVCMGIISEIAQSAQLIKGTFDPIDVLFFVMGGSLAIGIIEYGSFSNKN